MKAPAGCSGPGILAGISPHPCGDQGAHCRPLDPAPKELSEGKKHVTELARTPVSSHGAPPPEPAGVGL